MSALKYLAATTLCVLLGNFCFGQAQNFTYSDQGPITIGTTLSFQSEVMAEEQEILVSLPPNYDSSSKRYPVVYLLDAQYFFEFQLAYGLINTLTFFEEIPELILVGVASGDRNRDMVPSTQNAEGNAENFLEFFRRELQPFINQKYRTEPYKILIGHSAGGLFALYTLFQSPDTFNAYIAISPAVWSDEGKFIDELKKVLGEDRELNNSLFTSLASEGGDEREMYDRFVEMVSEAGVDGLEFSYMDFLEEDHGSTLMPGIREGLLAMYEDWGPPDSIDSLEELLSHYRKLSEQYGYPVTVPVRHASDAGFNLIRIGDPAAALEIFEYSLSNISQDAIGHYQVAVALHRLGRFNEALSEYEKAIELGPGTDMYPVFVSRRDEVAKAISEQEESE
jgi:predicted alpha/beta superfamily hydrolase